MGTNAELIRSWGTTLLRVTVGTVFVAHGVSKLFMGFTNVTDFLTPLGIPYPTIAAVVLTLVELLGGLAMILGVLTRYVAIMLAFDMAVAIMTVHMRNGFFMPNGLEYPMVLLAANLNFVLAGGGAAELWRF
ncbi:MAG: DoxX family protein [Acidobacteriia bacterium]|nr:DoxX family protein [Terriglobia bacterium]